MAKPRGGKQSARNYDVEDLVALVGALSNIRNGGVHPAPTDPSTNVKELVELRANYEKEIRVLGDQWQARYDAERRTSLEGQQRAEAGRIDSQLMAIQRSADATAQRLSDAAITLANTVTTTAGAAQQAMQAAADNQRELVDQVRRSVELVQTQVTQLTAGGVGAGQQRQETRQISMWAIGIAVGLLVVIGNYIAARLGGG